MISSVEREPHYDVVWPLSRVATVSSESADRLASLSGKTVAELWDYNFRGEVIFPLFREHLRERFPDIKIVQYSNFENFHGPGGEAVIASLPEELKALGCDAVIIGLGACGGCTPAVMRAAAKIEKLGIPTVSIVATGFLKQAELVSRGLGTPTPIAEYPGHPTTDTLEELTGKIMGTTAPRMVEAFMSRLVDTEGESSEPSPNDIVFSGTFDAVQDHFEKNLWTDGLPIVPPTRQRIDSFLAYTDWQSDEVIATVPIEGREATIYATAVTGVMAGCRPEYMPVLVAIVEAMCDPRFKIQSGGTTPGWEPLVIVSGPIAKELGFHHGQGLQRLGHRPNSSVGRFVRLFLRNICGYRVPPGGGDKSAVGNGFLVAIAEDEAMAHECRWPTYAESRGFKRGDSVVTVRSVVAATPGIYTSGDTPLDHVVDWATVMTDAFGSWSHMDLKHGDGHYLLMVSPLVTRVVAREWSKETVRNWIHANAKITARRIEHFAHAIGNKLFSLETQVSKGILPDAYALSPDKDRLVDFFVRPEAIEILVAGDPDRNQSRAYMCNHDQGAPSSKQIQLPKEWSVLRGRTA